MNKVFNINLGGVPLTIDEDAYRYLENYLQTLHNHFRNSEGYEEIMSDIEARIGELLKENMGKRAIAMIQDPKGAASAFRRADVAPGGDLPGRIWRSEFVPARHRAADRFQIGHRGLRPQRALCR